MAFMNWWNQNFVQPSTEVYQGTQFASQPYQNSTGVIAPTPGTLPASTDNYTFLNNNIASRTAGSSSMFSPIGSSAVNNAIAGTTPTSLATQPASLSMADQYGYYNQGYGATNNVTNSAVPTAQTGFDWGGLSPANWDWSTIGNVTDTAAGLFSIYQGMQGLNMAQDQFDFRKNAWQQDYNQRLEAYNTEIERRAGRDAALAGG